MVEIVGQKENPERLRVRIDKAHIIFEPATDTFQLIADGAANEDCMDQGDPQPERIVILENSSSLCTSK